MQIIATMHSHLVVCFEITKAVHCVGCYWVLCTVNGTVNKTLFLFFVFLSLHLLSSKIIYWNTSHTTRTRLVNNNNITSSVCQALVARVAAAGWARAGGGSCMGGNWLKRIPFDAMDGKSCGQMVLGIRLTLVATDDDGLPPVRMATVC